MKLQAISSIPMSNTRWASKSVKTAQGTFYRIVKVTKEDIPDIEADVTQYKLVAVRESARQDLEYRPAQAGTTLTAQWRGGPGLGTITNTQGRTLNDINRQILEWYYSDNNRMFHIFFRDPSLQGGQTWDDLAINGVIYDLTASGVNQGLASVPHGTAAGTRADYYRLTLPSNPVVGGLIRLNPGDRQASAGSRWFVGNPVQEERLVEQATTLSFGRRFPANPVNDEVWMLTGGDGAPGTFTDEDGNDSTTGYDGDVYQYDHTTNKWVREHNASTHRPIASATVGNTDAFPTGAGNKVAFERANNGLPAYASRRANSIVLDNEGRPYVYTGGQQLGLAWDSNVLHRGESPFPARQALTERQRDDVRFQIEEHVTAVRLDQTITFPAWTLRDWSGNTPGQHVYNQSFVRSSTVPDEDIASITYYSQNYYDQNLRGRFVIRYHGDAGNNFNPLRIRLYLSSSTNPRGEEVTLDLVKERTYWKTAVQVPDQFRPETGSGGDVRTRPRTDGNAIRYNNENGSSNFEFLTDESLVVRYVPEDNLGRHVRGRIVWEMNETTRALLQNYNSSYWFVMGDSGSNPFVIGALQDWVKLTPFIKVGNRTGLLFGHPFYVGELKNMARLGSNTQNLRDERAWSGATSISQNQPRPRRELMSVYLNKKNWGGGSGGANCLDIEVDTLVIPRFGIWVSNALAIGADHADYFTAGSRWGFIGEGY